MAEEATDTGGTSTDSEDVEITRRPPERTLARLSPASSSLGCTPSYDPRSAVYDLFSGPPASSKGKGKGARLQGAAKLVRTAVNRRQWELFDEAVTALGDRGQQSEDLTGAIKLAFSYWADCGQRTDQDAASRFIQGACKVHAGSLAQVTELGLELVARILDTTDQPGGAKPAATPVLHVTLLLEKCFRCAPLEFKRSQHAARYEEAIATAEKVVRAVICRPRAAPGSDVVAAVRLWATVAIVLQASPNPTVTQPPDVAAAEALRKLASWSRGCGWEPVEAAVSFVPPNVTHCAARAAAQELLRVVRACPTATWRFVGKEVASSILRMPRGFAVKEAVSEGPQTSVDDGKAARAAAAAAAALSAAGGEAAPALGDVNVRQSFLATAHSLVATTIWRFKGQTEFDALEDAFVWAGAPKLWLSAVQSGQLRLAEEGFARLSNPGAAAAAVTKAPGGALEGSHPCHPNLLEGLKGEKIRLRKGSILRDKETSKTFVPMRLGFLPRSADRSQPITCAESAGGVAELAVPTVVNGVRDKDATYQGMLQPANRLDYIFMLVPTDRGDTEAIFEKPLRAGNFEHVYSSNSQHGGAALPGGRSLPPPGGGGGGSDAGGRAGTGSGTVNGAASLQVEGTGKAPAAPAHGNGRSSGASSSISGSNSAARAVGLLETPVPATSLMRVADTGNAGRGGRSSANGLVIDPRPPACSTSPSQLEPVPAVLSVLEIEDTDATDSSRDQPDWSSGFLEDSSSSPGPKSPTLKQFQLGDDGSDTSMDLECTPPELGRASEGGGSEEHRPGDLAAALPSAVVGNGSEHPEPPARLPVGQTAKAAHSLRPASLSAIELLDGHSAGGCAAAAAPSAGGKSTAVPPVVEARRTTSGSDVTMERAAAAGGSVPLSDCAAQQPEPSRMKALTASNPSVGWGQSKVRRQTSHDMGASAPAVPAAAAPHPEASGAPPAASAGAQLKPNVQQPITHGEVGTAVPAGKSALSYIAAAAGGGFASDISRAVAESVPLRSCIRGSRIRAGGDAGAGTRFRFADGERHEYLESAGASSGDMESPVGVAAQAFGGPLKRLIDPERVKKMNEERQRQRELQKRDMQSEKNQKELVAAADGDADGDPSSSHAGNIGDSASTIQVRNGMSTTAPRMVPGMVGKGDRASPTATTTAAGIAGGSRGADGRSSSTNRRPSQGASHQLLGPATGPDLSLGQRKEASKAPDVRAPRAASLGALEALPRSGLGAAKAKKNARPAPAPARPPLDGHSSSIQQRDSSAESDEDWPLPQVVSKRAAEPRPAGQASSHGSSNGGTSALGSRQDPGPSRKVAKAYGAGAHGRATAPRRLDSGTKSTEGTGKVKDWNISGASASSSGPKRNGKEARPHVQAEGSGASASAGAPGSGDVAGASGHQAFGTLWRIQKSAGAGIGRNAGVTAEPLSGRDCDGTDCHTSLPAGEHLTQASNAAAAFTAVRGKHGSIPKARAIGTDSGVVAASNGKTEEPSKRKRLGAPSGAARGQMARAVRQPSANEARRSKPLKKKSKTDSGSAGSAAAATNSRPNPRGVGLQLPPSRTPRKVDLDRGDLEPRQLPGSSGGAGDRSNSEEELFNDSTPAARPKRRSSDVATGRTVGEARGTRGGDVIEVLDSESEDLEALPDDVPIEWSGTFHGFDIERTWVRKQFQPEANGELAWFEGWVVSYQKPYFKVKYEDSDMEDMDIGELRKVVVVEGEPTSEKGREWFRRRCGGLAGREPDSRSHALGLQGAGVKASMIVRLSPPR